MSELRCQAIARIAERYRVHVIEDDVHGPLADPTSNPIASLISELGVYLTVRAECVLTGLRIRYLAVPRRLALRAESVVQLTSWMASGALAEVATRRIRDGTVTKLVEVQRERLSTKHQIINDVLGDYVEGQRREGLSAWLSVPAHWQVDSLVQEPSKRDIAITPPNPFLVRATEIPRKVRLCIGVEATDAAYRTTLETIAEVFAQYPQFHVFV